MHVDVASLARGVPPHAALVWWTDFQEGRHDHPFVPLQRRRILERDHEHVVMEDRAPLLLFREKVNARVLADRVEFDGTNTYATFTGAYVFEPRGPDDTRVRLVADVRLKRAIRPADRLAAPMVRALLKADLRAHVREMTRERSRGQ